MPEVQLLQKQPFYLKPQETPHQGFAVWLTMNDRRPTTVKRHLNNLRYILKNVPELTLKDTDAFLYRMKESGKKGSYLNSLINTIRLYSQFKNLDLHLQKYPQFRKDAGMKATMSDDEVEAFLNLPCPFHACKSNWDIWTVFFSICAFTGMRPGEVAHLKVMDCDFGRGVFVIRQSKTNQPGVAPIPPNIKELLQRYIAQLKGNYLFPSKMGGNHYSTGNEAVFDNVDWHRNFHVRLKVLGIQRPNLTSYSFRHSYATRLLEENVSLFHVKKLMRHNDLKSTLVYEHLTTKDLIQAQSKLPLIRRGTNPKTILQEINQVFRNFELQNDPRFQFSIQESENTLAIKIQLKKGGCKDITQV